jgi:tetratricopeptide (TPR) repeat protein
VSKRHWLIPIIAFISLWNVAFPASGQALLPYTPKLDTEDLEQTGLDLVQDAVQLIRFQQYQIALPRAKLATQLAPGLYQSWFILGSLYVQQQKIDDGITVLRKANTLAPKEPGILFTLGSAHFQKKDYTTAVRYLEQGLKIESKSVEALFDLGNAYLMLNQHPKAIESYNKSLGLDQNFWPAMNNIGLVQYEQGKVQEAIQSWQKAEKIDSTAAEPQLAIAVALYTQGQKDQGISLGQKALSMDPRYGKLEFLEENLWGEKLLRDTELFLAIPQIKAHLDRLESQPPEVQILPQ